MILRQLRDTEEDAEAVLAVATAAVGASRALTVRPDGSGPPGHVGPRPGGWSAGSRARHLARTDPGGCWLAADDSGMPVGAALSSRREGTWGLSMFTVLPRAEDLGVGRELLAAVFAYGRACLRGIVCAPGDPRSAATYRRAGLTLHPAMELRGPVDKAALSPPDGPVHEGTARHQDMMDSVDRRTRGGAHGPDHTELLRHHQLFVVDDLAGSGYVYVARDGRVEALAATSRRLAKRLLTAALLSLPEGVEVTVPYLTAEQEWAVDVGLEATLRLSNSGYVCLRGMRPPMPYIPSDAYL